MEGEAKRGKGGGRGRESRRRRRRRRAEKTRMYGERRKGREQREGSKEEDKGIESLKSTVRTPACSTKTNECYLECTAQKTTGI